MVKKKSLNSNQNVVGSRIQYIFSIINAALFHRGRQNSSFFFHSFCISYIVCEKCTHLYFVTYGYVYNERKDNVVEVCEFVHK